MNNKIIYNDDVIEACIFSDSENVELKSIAIRYLKPTNYIGKDGKDGKVVEVTNAMGGKTDWFVLPYTFGAVIGKKLFEQKNAGLDGFNDDGYQELRNWLIEMEEIDDAMCY